MDKTASNTLGNVPTKAIKAIFGRGAN